MPAPYNYILPGQSPTEQMLSGLKMGASIADLQSNRQINELNLQKGQMELANMQQAQANAEQRRQQLAAFIQKPNKTAADYQSAYIAFPEMHESLKKSWDTYSEEKMAASLGEMSQVAAALRSGKPEMASEILTRRADALANSSANPQEIDAAKRMADLAKTDPNLLLSMTSARIGAAGERGVKLLEGMDKASAEARTAELHPVAVRKAVEDANKASADAINASIEAQFAAPKAKAELAKFKAETSNQYSQINDRASRLQLDRTRLNADIANISSQIAQRGSELPASALTLVNEASINSVVASNAASKSEELATKLETQGGGAGRFSPAMWWNDTFGTESAWADARREYVRLRNSAAVKSLPPGPATDKDIDLALKGFPTEKADAATLASFLRGQAKLQRLEATSEQLKSEWVSQNKHAGTAMSDMVINGVRVAKGVTFPEFMKQNAQKMTDTQTKLDTQRDLSKRSYMNFANPASGALGSGTYPTTR